MSCVCVECALRYRGGERGEEVEEGERQSGKMCAMSASAEEVTNDETVSPSEKYIKIIILVKSIIE